MLFGIDAECPLSELYLETKVVKHRGFLIKGATDFFCALGFVTVALILISWAVPSQSPKQKQLSQMILLGHCKSWPYHFISDRPLIMCLLYRIKVFDSSASWMMMMFLPASICVKTMLRTQLFNPVWRLYYVCPLFVYSREAIRCFLYFWENCLRRSAKWISDSFRIQCVRRFSSSIPLWCPSIFSLQLPHLINIFQFWNRRH